MEFTEEEKAAIRAKYTEVTNEELVREISFLAAREKALLAHIPEDDDLTRPLTVLNFALLCAAADRFAALTGQTAESAPETAQDQPESPPSPE